MRRLFAVIFAFLGIVIVSCEWQPMSPCREISWHLEYGGEFDREMVLEAARLWGEAGVSLVESDTPDVSVYIMAGVLSAEPDKLAVTRRRAGLMAPSIRIYVDAAKVDNRVYQVAIIAHEFGHAMGLEHVISPEDGGELSVMNTRRWMGDVTSLPEHDKRVIRSLCGP